MLAPSRIEVNLSAIERNLAIMRRVCSSRGSSVGVCAVLKADAYGLGAPLLGPHLETSGVEMFAGFSAQQAEDLLAATQTTPVLILAPLRELPDEGPLARAIEHSRAHLAVHDPAQARALADAATGRARPLPVHIEINTGMNRGGIAPEEAEAALRIIAEAPSLRLTGAYTHYSSASRDPQRTFAQSRAFNRWLAQHADLIPADVIRHEAATYATFRSSELHASMVRVGLGLVGFAREQIADPDNCELLAFADELRPAVRWMSQVVHASWIETGEAVGYGAKWIAPRRTRLGLVPIGYADGYPVSLTNKSQVGVEVAPGEIRFAPVVGRISMDQITIDLTDMPEAAQQVGTPIEVVGADREAPNHLPKLAKLSGRITHEFLTSLSPRVPRVVVGAVKAPHADALHAPL